MTAIYEMKSSKTSNTPTSSKSTPKELTGLPTHPNTLATLTILICSGFFIISSLRDIFMPGSPLPFIYDADFQQFFANDVYLDPELSTAASPGQAFVRKLGKFYQFYMVL